jgi:hypothetical protein
MLGISYRQIQNTVVEWPCAKRRIIIQNQTKCSQHWPWYQPEICKLVAQDLGLKYKPWEEHGW